MIDVVLPYTDTPYCVMAAARSFRRVPPISRHRAAIKDPVRSRALSGRHEKARGELPRASSSCQ